MSEKRIDTGVIESTAGTIDSMNSRLGETLAASKSTIQSLSGVWSGSAAEATISAYNAFEAKYSTEYRELLEKYSRFLRGQAAATYQQTETKAASMADEI